MMKSQFVSLAVAFLSSAALTGILVAQDKEKAAEVPGLDFKQYSAPDVNAFRASKLYYITPRGGFGLTAQGGHAVYEYNSTGYDTDWEYIGQNSRWFIFKEKEFRFWMAFERVAPYQVRYSHSGSGEGSYYANAKVFEE